MQGIAREISDFVDKSMHLLIKECILSNIFGYQCIQGLKGVWPFLKTQNRLKVILHPFYVYRAVAVPECL
jgi:hypothetical protein